MSHPCPILLFMVLEAVERAETAAADLLAAVNAGAASTAELCRVLAATRCIAAAVNAAQTVAAELIARRERHGDGGTEILASAAGLSQRAAHDQVATAAALRQVPRLRDAVQAGDVPQANARRLADAITKTGPEAVAGDSELLAQAQSMRPEQFAKTAQRWIGAQQADGGTAEYLRQRAKRYLRIFDTDDGMVCLHGEFDKITGTRLHNRLRHTASRLLDADKKLPEEQRRKFPQCMADALQHYTTRTSPGGGQNAATANSSTGCGRDRRGGDAAASDAPVSSVCASRATASPGNASGDGDSDGRVRNLRELGIAGPGNGDSTGCGCAPPPCNTDAATRIGAGLDGSGDARTGNPQTGETATTSSGNASGGTATGCGDPEAGPASAETCHGAGCGCAQPPRNTDAGKAAVIGNVDSAVTGAADDDDANAGSATGGGGAAAGWVADITVLAHVDDATGELIGELSDGSKLPAAVLEELSCNARWAGLVFDRAGDAIWRSRSRRTVTDTQWQALLATYGGCFHCGAPAGMCQAHHITPYSQGGATNLKNLIMVCWNCHHKIHHHNWQIEKHLDGSHSLHPPDDTATATNPRYGPAHAQEPEPPQRRKRPPARPENTTQRTRTRARDPASATLW